MEIAKPLLDEIKAGISPYQFIEIMGCPGGCVNGGGQSYVPALVRNSGFDWKTARAKALYEEDKIMPLRRSHQNTQILALYKDYLGEPNSHLHMNCFIRIIQKNQDLNNHEKGNEIAPSNFNLRIT